MRVILFDLKFDYILCRLPSTTEMLYTIFVHFAGTNNHGDVETYTSFCRSTHPYVYYSTPPIDSTAYFARDRLLVLLKVLRCTE